MKIAKYVTLIMAILGVMVTLVTIHEFGHFLDVRKNAIVDEVCILAIPNNLLHSAGGYVTYYPDTTKPEPKTSEFKQYLISVIAGFILIFFIIKYIYFG